MLAAISLIMSIFSFHFPFLGDSGEANGRYQSTKHMLIKATRLREEGEASKGPSLELPKVQLHKHQVLLLQQLLSDTAKILLQDL